MSLDDVRYGADRPSRAELSIDAQGMPVEPADARCPNGHLLDRRHAPDGACICVPAYREQVRAETIARYNRQRAELGLGPVVTSPAEVAA